MAAADQVPHDLAAVTPPAAPPALVVIGQTPLATAIAAQGGVAALPADAALPALPRRTIVIDTGDDLVTLATLARAMDAARPGERILAQIADPALREIADQHLDARGLGAERPRLFAAATLAAQRLVATAALHEIAFWRGQGRVHAAIVGWGPLGRACLEAIVVSGIAGALGRPQLTVLAEDVDAARAEIRSACPELDASADVVFAPYTAQNLDDPDASALAVAGDAGPLTAVILALPYRDALRAARRLQPLRSRIDAALFLVADRPLPALALMEQDGRDLARRVATIDPLGPGGDLAAELATGEVLPRRMHDAYVAQFGGSAVAPDWDDLAEGFKAANRSAAAHIALKLWSLGLVPGPDPDLCAIEPQALAALTRRIVAPQTEDAAVRQLARLEHERWSAERRLGGWRYGTPRDDAAKHHPDLVPFDDPRLTAAEIAKDIAQVRFVLGSSLHASAGGWAAPLVLAVTATAEPGAAIGREAALALMGQEPWRPVTLLCALHRQDECDTVRALIDAIEPAGRNWRLIVPETEAALRPAAAAALLAMPRTIVSPLSHRRVAAPGWLDPSDAAGDVTLQAYLAARATALVSCEAR